MNYFVHFIHPYMNLLPNFKNSKSKSSFTGSYKKRVYSHNIDIVILGKQPHSLAKFVIFPPSNNNQKNFFLDKLRSVNEWVAIALAGLHTCQYLFRHAIVAHEKLYIMS